MKRRTYLIIFLLFISYSTFSMNIEWLGGYIVTNNNDTIIGQVAYRNDNGDWKECLFRKLEKETPITYSPDQINAYGYQSGLAFVSKQIKLHKVDQKVFAQPLLTGTMNLYYLAIEKCTEFPKGYFAYITELPSGEMVEFLNPAKSENQNVVKKRNKIKLDLLFSEYPQLQEEIRKTYADRDQWISLLQKYHEITCNEYTCVTYQEKSTSARWFLTPNLFLNYNNINRFKNGVYPGFGVVASCSFDKFTDRNILNIGLEMAWNRLKTEEYSLRSEMDMNTIRISNFYSYEYRFTNTKVMPLLEVGLYHGLQFTTEEKYKAPPIKYEDGSESASGYKPYYMGFIVGTGVVIKLNKNQIPIKLQYRYPLLSPESVGWSVHIATVELSAGFTFKL